MSTKFSIYAGAPVERALSCLGADYAQNRSGRLNSVCERYLAMVADELGRLAFSRTEWCAILDANTGVDIGADYMSLPPMLVWANVHDSRGLGKKWEVDQAALVARLQALPRASLVAIQEAADRFWSHSELPTGEALAKAGISVADEAGVA